MVKYNAIIAMALNFCNYILFILSGIYQKGIRVFGQLDFNNGFVYKGYFENNMFSGQGQLMFPSKKILAGKWVNGTIEGNALIKYFSGDLYYGEIKQFKKHGNGYLFFKNGDKYVGQFTDGQIKGEGEYYQNDKCIGRGYWQNGQLIQLKDSLNGLKFTDSQYVQKDQNKYILKNSNSFLENLSDNKYSILPNQIIKLAKQLLEIKNEQASTIFQTANKEIQHQQKINKNLSINKNKIRVKTNIQKQNLNKNEYENQMKSPYIQESITNPFEYQYLTNSTYGSIFRSNLAQFSFGTQAHSLQEQYQRMKDTAQFKN